MQRKDIPTCFEMATECFDLQLNYKEKQAIKLEFEMAVDYGFKQSPIYYIAEHKGEMIGMYGFSQSMMDWESYEFYWLCVKQKYRKRGIGEILVNHCQTQICSEFKVGQSVTILLSCIKQLTAFYRNLGFKIVVKKAGKEEVLMAKTFIKI